jgi:outer membrane protein assembly factor BamA
MELYLRNKGYYKGIVSDTTIIKNQKALTIFNITLNEPFRIGNIEYEFEDGSLAEYILPDTVNSLLKRGDMMDLDIISGERKRIENMLKANGFYYFSENYIYFNADSSGISEEVDLLMVVKKYREFVSDENYRDMSHPRYRIGKVFINTNYKPRDVLSNNPFYFEGLDTIIIDNIHIIYFQEPNIKPSSVIPASLIIPGQFYSLNNVTGSYRHFSSLQLFRLITIDFKDTGETGHDGSRLLDCNIDLTPQTLQSFAAEIEGTNSSGNIGAAGNLIFQNRNLFSGAENFNLKLKGAVETLRETREYNFGNMLELGAETSLRIPKFLLPLKTEQFIRKYSPSTTLTLGYNYQRRPDYIRTLANASLSYNWKGNKNLTHIASPIEVNLVKIPYKSQDFSDWLEGKYIFYSYQPHLISLLSYSLIFSNQNIQKTRDFTYVRLNTESAGNLLWSAYHFSGAEERDGKYRFLNSEFSQYLRGDIDFRYYNVINENRSFVYRVFAGLGFPYGNSAALPFEKKYFSGGANSIRAWQVRNLGPGSFSEIQTGYYPNQTGDIKLEANIEYRFKMFWLLEGALFVDAGNIWAINENDEREGALFEMNKFHKDIAVGTGMGVRFDFSYFIFRLDLGVKTRDPSVISGSRWLIGNRKLNRDDLTLNLGIGYPF